MKFIHDLRQKWNDRQKVGVLIKKFDHNARLATMDLAVSLFLAASDGTISYDEFKNINEEFEFLKEALKD